MRHRGQEELPRQEEELPRQEVADARIVPQLRHSLIHLAYALDELLEGNLRAARYEWEQAVGSLGDGTCPQMRRLALAVDLVLRGEHGQARDLLGHLEDELGWEDDDEFSRWCEEEWSP